MIPPMPSTVIPAKCLPRTLIRGRYPVPGPSALAYTGIATQRRFHPPCRLHKAIVIATKIDSGHTPTRRWYENRLKRPTSVVPAQSLPPRRRGREPIPGRCRQLGGNEGRAIFITGCAGRNRHRSFPRSLSRTPIRERESIPGPCHHSRNDREANAIFIHGGEGRNPHDEFRA